MLRDIFVSRRINFRAKIAGTAVFARVLDPALVFHLFGVEY
jgi:hypothetical protein